MVSATINKVQTLSELYSNLRTSGDTGFPSSLHHGSKKMGLLLPLWQITVSLFCGQLEEASYCISTVKPYEDGQRTHRILLRIVFAKSLVFIGWKNILSNWDCEWVWPECVRSWRIHSLWIYSYNVIIVYAEMKAQHLSLVAKWPRRWHGRDAFARDGHLSFCCHVWPVSIIWKTPPPGRDLKSQQSHSRCTSTSSHLTRWWYIFLFDELPPLHLFISMHPLYSRKSTTWMLP